MKIDPGKKYKTRDGREVANLVRVPENYEAIYPWTGFVEGEWQTWTDAGEYFAGCNPDGDSEFNLIEVREPLECWVRIRDDRDEVDEDFFPNKERLNPKWRLFREVID